MPSAPIIWGKQHSRKSLRAIVVNSGNANAHTGSQGIKIINEYVDFLSKKINCKKNQVLVSSTGVIGEIFDPKIIIRQLAKIENKLQTKLFEAAKAIMTTDTYPKISVMNVTINKTSFKIYGIAKGSGMIHPNMGTMLAYIFIDLDLPENILNKLLNSSLDKTFNSISTDGDMSTSDTLALFSSGTTKINLKVKKNYQKLNTSLSKLMRDLSLKIVRDGEGISKLIKVNVLNCKSIRQSKKVGFSIINSPLVKTAISGQDANWGRVIAAIGKSEEKINQNKIKIYFGKNLLCKNGSIYKNINYNKVNKYMKNKTIEISVILQTGKKSHTVYGNDLTNEYIRINADYRS
tara:strand:- start:84 stop:1127 length:1044 start_codon:yes stop_codon:yes gene_type:complete